MVLGKMEESTSGVVVSSVWVLRSSQLLASYLGILEIKLLTNILRP